MAYQCQGCGYKAAKRFDGGRCPACDSFDVKRIGASSVESRQTYKEPKTLIEWLLLIGLWGLLIYGAWDRYLRDWL